MKVLLSSIGSRGDVQPMLALALELRAMGHRADLCVPPNFQQWVESFGIHCLPVGQDVQAVISREIQNEDIQSPWPFVRFIRSAVSEQFEGLSRAARGYDLLVGGALQCAGDSVAEALKIPYVYALYCPMVVPSSEHPPPSIRTHALPLWLNRMLWKVGDGLWNLAMRGIVNEQRARLGLKPAKRLLRNLMTERPLLAADSVLGPAPMSDGMQIVQTGTWFLADPTPMPESLERFLASGEPPIYFGFGSIPNKTPLQTSKVLIEAARALGRRAIISQGWAGLDAIDNGGDCISIGPVSHEKLFPHVAAIVHHGGAGTTAAAARSGRPQVIVPHLLDQFYWRHRVQTLGIGISNVDIKRLNTRALIQALRECLNNEIKTRAQTLMTRIELHGAAIAAQRLISEFS